MTAFKKRGLSVAFQLAQGAFNNNGDDTVEISDLAISATINVFNMGMSKAQIMVTGLSTELVERLTTLKATPKGNAYQRNKVKLTLNEEDNTQNVVFRGDIFMSIPDFNAAPDVPMMINATALYNAMLYVPPPITWPGSTPAAVAMERLAKLAGFSITNHGVTVPVRDVSLNGDLGSMMRHVAAMANIDFYIEADTVHIAPKGQPRDDVPEIKISTEEGMIGYPRPIDFGCLVSCRYSSKYRMLAKTEVEVPEIRVVNGKMFIASAAHRLDTEIPRGQWFTNLKLMRFAGVQGA